MRYLSSHFLRAAINRGKGVAQFITLYENGNELCARWLLLSPEAGVLRLRRYDHPVERDQPDFLDIFEMAGGDELGYATTTDHDRLEDALLFAAEEHGAKEDRWVNDGVVQDEYGDSLRAWLERNG